MFKKRHSFFFINLLLGLFIYGFFLGNLNHESFNLSKETIEECASYTKKNYNPNYIRNCIIHSHAIFSLMILVGGAVGSLLSFSLLKLQYGRMKIIKISDLIGIIGMILAYFDSFPTFGFHRLICGVYSGLNLAIVPIIIKETINIKRFSYFASLPNVVMSFGVLVSYIEGISFVVSTTVILTILIFRLLVNLFIYPIETPLYYFYKEKEKFGKSLVFFEKYEQPERVEERLTQAQTIYRNDFEVWVLYRQKYIKGIFLSFFLNLLANLSGAYVFIYSSSFIPPIKQYTFAFGIYLK